MITTERLELRKFDGNQTMHLDMIARWLNDPEIVRYSEQRHHKHDWESQLEYIDNGPDIYRLIHCGPKFIGTISAYIDKPNSVADVGILIGDKSVWGKGYGTEAWIAFCDHLFLHKIRKIEAGAMNINAGMIAIFQKYRMHFEGYRNGHFIVNGEPVHMVMWGKFAP